MRTGLIKLGGQDHPTALLTDDDVIEIKKQLINGVKGRDIAKIFGVSEYNISVIKRNKSWKHIII